MGKLKFLLIYVLVAAVLVSGWNPVSVGAKMVTKFDQAPSMEEVGPQSSKKEETQTLVTEERNQTLVTNLDTTTIGKGIELTAFEYFDKRGWLNGEMLKVDLSNESISANLLEPGVVSKSEPLSEIAKREHAIAGVNGDFFDINGTKASTGAEVKSGKLIKGANNGRTLSTGITVDGMGHLVNIMLNGTVKLPGSEEPLQALNQSAIPTDGIGLYTADWGEASRSGSVNGSKNVFEVTVEDGKVIETTQKIGSGIIEDNAFVLVGREKGACVKGVRNW